MPAFKDLTGQIFGRLTVVGISHKHRKASGESLIKWKCVCECGNIVVTSCSSLTTKNTQSCGCLRQYSRLKDLTGQKFGRLKVVKLSHVKGEGRHTKAIWECICECGNTTLSATSDLIALKSSSCGCLRKEKTTKHGKSSTKTYRIWQGMIQRCFNANKPAFKNYGGRGITVCERWLKFENFLTDMGEKPIGMSIERIDNSRGYSPENCKWATPFEQSQNIRGWSNSASQYKGVSVCSKRKKKKWVASICFKGIKYRLGEFASEIDAAKAYDQKARELGRHELTLNFPNLVTK